MGITTVPRKTPANLVTLRVFVTLSVVKNQKEIQSSAVRHTILAGAYNKYVMC